MDDSGGFSGEGITRRSRYRIKVAMLASVFLACGLVIKFVPLAHPELLLPLMALAAVPINFVRCERCHSSLYYRAGGTRVFVQSTPSVLRFVLAKRCPVCGLERI